MTIEIYPVKIEAVDSETNDMLFVLEAFDENCATLEMKCTLNKRNLDAFMTALHKAVEMLQLKDV